MTTSNEIKSTVFRWNKISVINANASSMMITEELAELMQDNQYKRCKLSSSGPRTVHYDLLEPYAFDDAKRLAIDSYLRQKYPEAVVAFYGTECVTIVGNAHCVNGVIQGSR